MSSYFGISEDSVSTLFSSLSGSTSRSTASSSTASLLSEYNGIKNGSYKKLLTAYYEKNPEASSSTSTSVDNTKTLASIKSDASSLSETATKLVQFDYKTTKEAYEGVSAYVDDYNALVDSSDNSQSTSIQKYMDSIKKSTSINQDLLKEIGITINSDDTLEINADKFNGASFSTIQSIFKGTGSYAYNTANSAINVSSAATLESTKSNTYNNSGSYSNNFSSGTIYSSLF